MRGPTRRRVLQGVTAGSAVLGTAGWGRFADRGAAGSGQSSALEVSIVDTDGPVSAGEYLRVTAEIENTGSADVRTPVELLVGDDREQLSNITTTISAGETRTMRLGFYTYPVPRDAEFPVRVVTDGDTDTQTVGVTGASWLSTARPEAELAVEPGTEVFFEAVADDLDESLQIVWWVDGEQAAGFAGPWRSTYYGRTGAHYWRESFETTGTHDVAAAVIPRNRDGTYTAHWRVDVTAGGHGSPTVDAVRPEPGAVPTTNDQRTFELEATDPDGGLDRVVWWLTQSDVILDITELEGSTDTAQLVTDAGCHTCQIVPWVICTNGTVASLDPTWQFDREADDGGDGDDGDDSDGGNDGDGTGGATLELSIRTTNSPVDAGESLEVIVDITNTGTETGADVLELVVGHDPKVLDTQETVVPPGETGTATLGFETYPTKQDEQFPVRVEGADDAVETSVRVFAR